MGKNTLADKRNLIHWFLDSQRLAVPNAEKILRRLLGSDELLKKIRLNPDSSSEGNLLLIAARGSQLQPFLLRINGQEAYEVEKALELLEKEEWNYLKLHLAVNRTFFCQFCATKNNEESKSAKARRKQLTKQMLLQMIDQALDFRDQRAFEVLTRRLKRLEEDI